MTITEKIHPHDRTPSNKRGDRDVVHDAVLIGTTERYLRLEERDGTEPAARYAVSNSLRLTSRVISISRFIPKGQTPLTRWLFCGLEEL